MNSLDFFMQDSFFSNKSTIMDPLIKSKWGQSISNDSLDSTAYNFFTPTGDSCQHTLAGCPAVALGQILRYHLFPSCPHFNFSNMPDSLITTDENYLSHKIEISNFLRNIGDKMNNDNHYFGCHASGATLDTIFAVIKRDFLFYKAYLFKRHDYNYHEWKNLIINELSQLRPILYLGYSLKGGHAFICDGFNQNLLGTFFHFNLGWNGKFDGYYKLNVIYPIDQAAIFLIPNDCSSFLAINQSDKFVSGNFYSPMAGVIYSSPTFVQINTGESVHYTAFQEIILDNFEATTGSDFIAEIIPCVNCNFIDYRQYYHNFALIKNDLYIYQDTSLINDVSTIYPNPFHNHIQIDLSLSEAHIIIFDIYGKVVFEQSLNFGHNVLNLSFLKPGTYILSFSNTQQSQFLKIIKL